MGNRINLLACRRKLIQKSGFTLVELIVVIALLSIMLAFALPRFEGNMLADNNKKVTRWFMNQVQILRQNSLKNRKVYILNISPDAGTMWITDESMTEEDLETASQNGYSLPDDITITGILYPDGDKISFGSAEIRFYKTGYSDKVIIHIEDDDNNPVSLLIEPFLPAIKVYEQHIDFES
ncbi:Prepilin-type cleavage/methylation N-terminal domain-containing protein [Desulfonema limicola]|uniref:Prepilin-type cleavage/methylation N-terminal domain-containing protein n=1 Tax=Desulfonema limicola TaxID=45656 RepID=A0A975B4E5_9BACT|nr:type II secretion system protein [Desulfonema limicola]QTA78571.1 Prepilin-type cleavage/methylation N-terminal domain-containing protein [Desulfonema limicola]